MKTIPLFAIEPRFVVPDVLHMRIRVVNRLIDGLLAEAEDRDNRNSVTNVSAKGVHVGAIVDVINSCSVKFEVWMEEKRVMLSEASTSFGTASPEPSGQQFVGTMPIETTPKTARIRVWKMRTPSTKRKLQHYRSIIMRLGRVIVSMKRPVKRTVSHTRLIAEAGKHLSKDLLELLNVQVHLQPLRKH
ncbi:hypothetical protein MRX96_030093 [Rhipicephalus microplus]